MSDTLFTPLINLFGYNIASIMVGILFIIFGIWYLKTKQYGLNTLFGMSIIIFIGICGVAYGITHLF